jgi:hypothetical protein
MDGVSIVARFPIREKKGISTFMNTRLLSLAAVLIGLFGTAPGRGNDIPSLIEAARADFQPVGEQNIELALRTMRSAQKEVNRIIAARPDSADSWRKYLLWDQQNRQLASAANLDTSFWRTIYQRELNSSSGLDHTAFQQHRAAIRTLINTLESAADAMLTDRYQSTLDQLESLLGEGADTLGPDQAQQVSQLLEQLDQQQQAPALIEAVTKSYSQRNLLMYVPDEYLTQQRSDMIERSFPVNERVAGAKVRGSGVMTAQYDWTPVPSDDGATWHMSVHGDSNSRTTAYQDRISVHNRSSLAFHSQGKVVFDLNGYRVSDFKTSGRLRLRGTSVRTFFRGLGLRHRIARRRALEQQASSRRISERNATRRISNSFRREVVSQLDEANRRYREQVLLPLKAYDQIPSDSMFRTTSDSFEVGLRLANSRQLTTGVGIDDFYTGSRFRLAVHQSALNNIATALAGKTRSLGEVLRQLQLGSPEETANEQPDVEISFAEESPLHLSLDDEKIAVRLSGNSFRRGGQKYTAMEIAFRYALRYEQGETFLALDGEPIVEHPRGPNGSRAKLGIRDLSLRRILLSILQRDLPSRIALDQLQLPLQKDLLGPLKVVHFQSQEGWAMLEAVRPLDLQAVASETPNGVVPVSFKAEDQAVAE